MQLALCCVSYVRQATSYISSKCLIRYSLISASSCSFDFVNGCRFAAHALPGWNQSQEGVIMLLRPRPGAWFPKSSRRQFHTGLNRSMTIDSASGIQMSSTARKRQRKSAKFRFVAASMGLAWSLNRLYSAVPGGL